MLKSAASPLFGRAAEIAELRRLLIDKHVRFLTLTGPGGTGKTVLAQALATDTWASTDRNTYFVDLGVVDDPALVPASIAQALGVQESGSEPVATIVRDLLARSPILLVLDSFERVMGATPFVAELLDEAPQLVCLVTSREPLHIRAEQVFPVGPLPVPSPEASDLASIAATPSVALFVDRGRARQPDLILTSESAPIVSEICRRLDGLPLAIELAAAQVSVLSLRAVLARLEAREPFVLDGGRDLPLRHQTLGAAVSWSYGLLEPTEQHVFRSSGVFSGSFAPHAVAEVVNFANPGDPLRVLAQLADKNLIQVAQPGSVETRFRMLETIRSVALDLLHERGDLLEMRCRHAAYYVALAEQAEHALVGPNMADTLDRLEREYDNFRAVMHYSLECGDLHAGLRLAGALHRFWLLRGRLTEARDWLDRALPRSKDLATDVRAKALNAAGVLAGMQGDHRTAEKFFLESFELWQQRGDSIRMAVAMGNLGLAAQDRQDVTQALRCFQQAQALYAAGGDRRGIAVALGSRAQLARHQGSPAEAIPLLEQALALFREVGDPRGIANALANLGHARIDLRQPEQSIQCFREALELRQSLGNTLGIAECLEGFAAAAAARRQGRRGARLLGAAATLRETTGAPVPGPDRKQYASVLARIQQQLQPDVLAREQAAGRTMTHVEAVEYALEHEGEGLSRAPRSSALTERERDVALLVARGLTNKQIAERLSLARRTVTTHLEHIFAKLGVQARAEVAVWITRSEPPDDA
ncbi:MAG TPA: tetratricopeptide repeat protein [Chloroflexota bacterium]|nr:tetratricopeptide repeat protein [Chloroflexota bacterium]